MESKLKRDAALSPYRVLDMTGDIGQLCGRIFSDLGADVIKIERPGGDPARAKAPFYRDVPGPDHSLFWLAYNVGKKSITLNLEFPEGQDILKQLAAKADFFIESFSPGYLNNLGLGYEILEQVNPGLIMASITPFGQTGPRASWKGPDLVTWALGGYMWMTGEPVKAPLRISHPPQAFLHASAMAAVGCLMALHYRHKTGKGQHVDLAAQQCPSWMLTNTYAFWDLQRKKLERDGVYRQFGPNRIKTVWRAKDGHITFMFSGGAIGAKGQRRVVEWMDEEGMAPDWLKQIKWEEMSAFSTHESGLDRITEAFGRFFETKTKKELLDQAIQWGIMMAPVNTVADVVDDPQLEARGFWNKAAAAGDRHPVKMPGAPVKMSRTPWQSGLRASFIGEHNHEIYQKDLGLSDEQVMNLQKRGVI
jgi:crotonobetainyl-CoA:carnitine CoA-transferase CaiB-like acyl-CoA transferase